jgi:hypothetical protein
MQGRVNQPAVLTGDMVAADLLAGKTGYGNDPNTKITGTLTSVPSAAGNVLIYEQASSSGSTLATYEKKVEITVNGSGTFRIKVYLAGSHGGFTYYARVYRNGSAVGTELSVTPASGSSYSWVTDDVSGWSPGDKLQIYLRRVAGGTTCVQGGLQVLTTFCPVSYP